MIEFFNFGNLGDYFLGAQKHRYWGKVRKIAVLGCGDCGNVGCWPLQASVARDDRTVKWFDFEQPFRSERDYTELGSFTFDRGQYEAAIADVVAQIS